VKGDLVRAILYPKPIDFEFTRDTLRFIGVLALLASLGFVYSFIQMVRFLSYSSFNLSHTSLHLFQQNENCNN